MLNNNLPLEVVELEGTRQRGVRYAKFLLPEIHCRRCHMSKGCLLGRFTDLSIGEAILSAFSVSVIAG
jgi:hypothetical protein